LAFRQTLQAQSGIPDGGVEKDGRGVIQPFSLLRLAGWVGHRVGWERTFEILQDREVTRKVNTVLGLC